MSHRSDPRFLVLHGLRLKGFAAEMALARLSGMAPGEVGSHLEKLQADGLAHHRDGRITGWALTAAGRVHHAEHVAAEVEAAGCRPAVESAYRRFVNINPTFLAVCTDWQVRRGPDGGQALNDHADPAYDASVIARLGEIDDAVGPICADLAAAMERFAWYGPRLREARDQVEAGRTEWFTGALIESYHTVWFELHEDLLATLGISRDGRD